jgi:hypothetical protein
VNVNLLRDELRNWAVTLSGGLFGGLDVMRGEYIDRPKPRRNWLHRFYAANSSAG